MHPAVRLLVMVAVPTAFALAVATTPQEASSNSVARGKYLVHHVAQCVQCHTPRDRNGSLMNSRLLTGAVIPVTGPLDGKPWAAASVALSGLGNYDETFVRYVLIHGQRPDGTQPKAPMPSFQLTERDAEAVIAYLRSLTL